MPFPTAGSATPATEATTRSMTAGVNMVDIRGLRQTRDLRNGRYPISLLDSTPLLEIARKAIDYGAGVAPIARPYLGEPLRFIFTITNLRGVPFEINLYGPSYSQTMMMHGDTIRFVLMGLGGTTAPPVRDNEYELAFPTAAEKWGGG
jgi:hypothetical protein